MYLRNICIILLASVGPHFSGGVQGFGGTQSTQPSWNHGNHAETERHSQHHLQPQFPTLQSPQHISEYPSEYTPYYPPQYTPPYPTQGLPQNPSQFKPPFPIQSKPQPSSTSTKPPPPFQHQVLHTQVFYPTIKPKPAVAVVLPTPAIDRYNHRFPDGSYEFRYELPDETVRYERGYFIYFHHKKSLVVRGFYSYRLPEKGYLTVFYTADHYGYRQDSSGITQHRPQLPRSLGQRRILPDEESINVVSSINETKLQ